jgi:FixJ family two-component response regulator
VSDEDLLGAIALAAKKDAESRKRHTELESINERFARLTPREREVLAHVIAGQLNKQIAHDLGLVLNTVKVHRGRVMEKMGVRSVAELVHLAERAGVRPWDASGR